jgi:hypothetical protein
MTKDFLLPRLTRAAVCFGLILSFAGCHDVQQSTGPEPSTTQLTQQTDPERQALERLARAVAIALGEQEFRSDVKGRMQKAPFKEHKLELRKFLTKSIAKSMADAAGSSPEAILADLALVRPLELYMPVESQRASWTGGKDLLVVAGIEEDDPIIGFDLRGNRVAVSNDAPPALPTIAIVPAETRFDEPVDSRSSININDQGSRSIGTLRQCGEAGVQCAPSRLALKKPTAIVECGDSCGGGGGGGYGPPGSYMTFSRIVDAKEPWWKGNPEVEVHIHGPVSAANSQYGADLGCSGEHALSERYFDQNGGFWNGSVLIIDQAQDAAINQLSDGYHVIFWEDDSTPCQLKTNENVLLNSIVATLSAAGTAALKQAKWGQWPLVAAAFVASLWEHKDWLAGNDDLIGILVPATSVWADGSNYNLMDGSSINGRVKIVAK